jgi:hypothetical protein
MQSKYNSFKYSGKYKIKLHKVKKLCKKLLYHFAKTTNGSTAPVCANILSDSYCNYFARYFCRTNSYYSGQLFDNLCSKSCKCGITTTASFTTTKPNTACKNIASDSVCNTFAPLGYCTISTSYLNGLLFSQACKQTCNKC